MESMNKSYIQSNMDGQEKEKISSILKQRLKNSKRNRVSTEAIDRYEITEVQRHMLEHELRNEKSASYNLVSCVTIEGELDKEALTNGFQALIEGNSVLRTKFIKEGNSFQQVIEKNGPVDIQFEEISQATQQDTFIEERIQEESRTKFSFEEGLLLRVRVIQQSQLESTMILTIHHAIADGWSLGILIHQLQHYYNAYHKGVPISLQEEKIRYVDYCRLKKERITHDEEAYWVKELNEAKILRIEGDWDRKTQLAYQGERMHFTLDSQLVNEVKEFSRNYHITMSNVFLGAYQLMLSKYTGQKDFVIGMAVADREYTGMKGLIGCCINTLGIRSSLDGTMSVMEYLTKIQQKTFEAFKHKHIDLYSLLDKIEYEKEGQYAPLFQVMFNYENTPKPALEFDGLKVCQKEVKTCTSLFDLSLSLFDNNQEITGFIEYRSEVFNASRIKELRDYLLHILGSLKAHIDEQIQSIALVTKEQQEELFAINKINQPFDNQLFMDRFDEIVKKWGDREAVNYEGNSLTYGQLDRCVNRVANQLATSAHPKEIMGVYMDKSVEVIVAILAILKAGMTYVPLDSSYPIERINYMVEDAGIKKMITQSVHKTQLASQFDKVEEILLIEDLLNASISETYEGNKSSDFEAIAYIIYTSGSTGNPKGVMVPHRGLYNTILEQERLFGLNEEKRVLQFASLCFDASIFEILMALGHGGALYLADKTKTLGQDLNRFIREKRITHICVTPSVLAMTDPTGLEELEVVIAGGEACSKELVNLWGVNHKFFNAYGPTEVTIWATATRCYPNEKVTIGKPLNHVEVYVLDKDHQLVPKGHIGELYIGGIGLSLGYLNREALNREKFIHKKWADGRETHLYASGDLVRVGENHQIEFIGRVDNQVKLRGFRIEIDEISSVLLTYKKVKEAVVGILKNQGTERLYAVVTANDEIDLEELREFLLARLPEYMVPSIIKEVEAVPLTLNGKTDHKKLEEMVMMHYQHNRKLDPPVTSSQERLHTLWKDVLGLEAIGIKEDFFELGGHSLTATKLANNISEMFLIEFTTVMVFSYPTILAMEEHINQLEKKQRESIKKAPVMEKITLSPQQKRLWFMEQMYEANEHYHIVTPIALEGSLDVEVLERSFYDVIKAHDILNVNFYDEEGEAYQYVNQTHKPRLNHYYLINIDESFETKEVDKILRGQSKRPFDLRKDLLVRGALIHLTTNRYIFVLTMHHIISDGWTIELFVEALSKRYNHYLHHADEEEIKERLNYFDYIYWRAHQEETIMRQKNYWKQKLDKSMQVVSLPGDYRRPKVQTNHGYTVTLALEEEITRKMKAFCSERKITPFMFMMTAFSIQLHKLTGSEDLPVGIPIAGRIDKEMENMLGFFINTLVIRCAVAEDETVDDLLKSIKDISLQAFENQEVPFEELVEMIQPERSLSHSPLVQVMLNVQNPEGIACNLHEVKALPYPLVQESTKFDMTLYVEEYLGKMTLRLVYNRDLYRQERAIEYLNQYKHLMNELMMKTHQKVRDISLLTPSFQGQLCQVVEGGSDDKGCLDELVAATAKAYPSRLAVTDGKETLTYEQLEINATKVANSLIAKNIGSGDCVIVYATRSNQLVVSLLGILKTGAAFCIFDPEHPKERLKRQFQVVKAKGVILLQRNLEEEIQALFGSLPMCETYEQLLEKGKSSALSRTKQLDDIAYVLFTSGTTGMPNCIQTAHRPVAHFLTWFIKRYEFDEQSVFGLFGGLAHDPLIREIFTPLVVGGKLSIRESKSIYDMEGTLKWMVEEGINEVNITPSLFMMLTEGHQTTLPEIKHYFFGGEHLLGAHIRRVREVSPKAKCSNFYGATETPQVMGYYDIPEDFESEKHHVIIQEGIDDVSLYLVNKQGQLAGLGELGEIYIKTPYLSEGYKNNEALNQEKFTYVDGCKVYKTGDLGRYQWDGSILIEGRKDSQIAIRGDRVEKVEIEDALLSHHNVVNAIVHQIELQDKKKVVAYVVLKESAVYEQQQMRSHLLSYLPMNVLPEQIMVVEEIPLTQNGKIDYERLPKEVENNTKAQRGPRNDVEVKVKEIWENVLGHDRFGIDDNFFDIGGHSLLLVQVKAKVLEVFNVEIRLLDLFTYPSVADISDYIGRIEKEVTKTEDVSIDNLQDRTKQQRKSFSKFKRKGRK